MESLQFESLLDVMLSGVCLSFPVVAVAAVHRPEYPYAIRKIFFLFSLSHCCCGLAQFYHVQSPILLLLKVLTTITVVVASVALWYLLPQLLHFHSTTKHYTTTTATTGTALTNNSGNNAAATNNNAPQQQVASSSAAITTATTLTQTTLKDDSAPTNSNTQEIQQQASPTASPTKPTATTPTTKRTTKPPKPTTPLEVLQSLQREQQQLLQQLQQEQQETQQLQQSNKCVSYQDVLQQQKQQQQQSTQLVPTAQGPQQQQIQLQLSDKLNFGVLPQQLQLQKQMRDAIEDKAKQHQHKLQQSFADNQVLRRSNEELAKEKLRWQLIWDVTPQILWLVGCEGQIVACNRKWYSYTNLTVEESLGQKGEGLTTIARKVLYPDEVKDYMDDWEACFLNGETFERKARVKRGVDGEYRWHLVTVVPVKDPGSTQIFQWCGIAADIHEAEMVAKLIADDSRRKCRFLATISHEMRTPLNGIIGMTTCLKDTKLTPSQSDCVTSLTQCADQLSVLVNNIIDLIQIRKKRVHLEDSVFSVRECVQDSLSLVVESAVNKNVSLTTDITVTQPIKTDYKRIRQILVNLLSNAVKFTPAGGMVAVGAHCTVQAGKPLLCFSVKDTGIGIPEEDIPKLFTMFSQLDSQGCRPFGGSGLGLAISKGIVSLLHGNIWCESTVGKGTTFHFTCPIPEKTEACGADPAVLQSPIISTSSVISPHLHTNCNNPRILVVDDNHLNQTVMKRTLESIGYTDLGVAGNGAEAFEMDWEQEQDPPHSRKEYGAQKSSEA